MLCLVGHQNLVDLVVHQFLADLVVHQILADQELLPHHLQSYQLAIQVIPWWYSEPSVYSHLALLHLR